MANISNINSYVMEFLKDGCTSIIFQIPKSMHMDLFLEIKSVFQDVDPYLRVASENDSIFIFKKRMPLLIRFLKNDPRFTLKKNEEGYFILNLR